MTALTSLPDMTAPVPHFARSALFAALLPLMGCTSGPQQPSDTVDDRSREQRFLSDIEETSATAADEEAATIEGLVEDERSDGAATAAIRPLAVDFAAVAGRWAADAETCEAEGTVLTLSSTRFESPDRRCDISNPIDAGGGSITATLSCEGGAAEGTAVTLVRLKPQGDELVVSFVGDSNPAQSYTHSP